MVVCPGAVLPQHVEEIIQIHPTHFGGIGPVSIETPFIYDIPLEQEELARKVFPESSLEYKEDCIRITYTGDI
jgi:hypothetical protein